MGNNLVTIQQQQEQDILNHIVAGATEAIVCDLLQIPMWSFIAYVAENPEFGSRIDMARAMRAERWVSNVVGLVTSESGKPIIHDKDDVPGVKLAVDTYKWLAKVDNPERYGDKQSVETHNTNVLEIRGLSPSEALEVLRNDPFAPAIPAEYTTITPTPIEPTEESDDDEDML